jgi:hypothetical protein
MPATLADEIAASGGPWMLSRARFRPGIAKGTKTLGSQIDISGRDVWSEVNLWGDRPAAERAGATLKRSGYTILGTPSTGPAFARPRSSPKEKGPLAGGPFEHLREGHAWSLELVMATRRGSPAFLRAPGWVAGAWCWAMDDGVERMLEIHVQIFSKSRSRSVDSGELARLTRAARSRLAPLGYRTLEIKRGHPPIAMFNKEFATLATARRARRDLDRALFGD